MVDHVVQQGRCFRPKAIELPLRFSSKNEPSFQKELPPKALQSVKKFASLSYPSILLSGCLYCGFCPVMHVQNAQPDMPARLSYTKNCCTPMPNKEALRTRVRAAGKCTRKNTRRGRGESGRFVGLPWPNSLTFFLSLVFHFSLYSSQFRSVPDCATNGSCNQFVWSS